MPGKTLLVQVCCVTVPLGTSGRRWVLDPIDGTKAFVRSVPLFGVLIGLEENGEPATSKAAIAARLYREVGCPRQRAADLAIAATAIAYEAALWTLNPNDFRDIPGLRLYQAPA